MKKIAADRSYRILKRAEDDREKYTGKSLVDAVHRRLKEKLGPGISSKASFAVFEAFCEADGDMGQGCRDFAFKLLPEFKYYDDPWLFDCFASAENNLERTVYLMSPSGSVDDIDWNVLAAAAKKLGPTEGRMLIGQVVLIKLAERPG
jgi:hypothetical protein